MSLTVGVKYPVSEHVYIGTQLDGSLHQGTSRVAGSSTVLPSTSISNGVPIPQPPATAIISRVTSFSPEWSTAAVAMIGTKLTEDIGIYALGGVTYAQFRREDGDPKRGEGVGPTVGAGAEYRIYGGWSLSAEYRFTQFDPITNRTRSSASSFLASPTQSSTGISSTVVSEKFTSDMHVARFGLKYYFE
ncbi:outer membrane protein [uncultured Enterovirga sp.]|uniref:outer membrane protein n=1 Tax=uncultured Enterovirga sp. TaxID=2026352 RepID=UPI0035CAC61C